MFLDLTSVPDGGTLLPKGLYEIVCDEAVVKQTKLGTGEYIKCKFKVASGDYMNQVLFHNFNIKNDNKQAVQIGLGQLKHFCKCAGLANVKLNSVSDLIGLRAIAQVNHKKSEGYDDQVVIQNFRPLLVAGAQHEPVQQNTEAFPF